MLTRVLKSRSAPPWERSILELVIELDLPDWAGIKKKLDALKRSSHPGDL